MLGAGAGARSWGSLSSLVTLLAGAALSGAAGDRAAVEFELRRQKEQKQIDSKVLLLVFEINRKITACSKSLN